MVALGAGKLRMLDIRLCHGRHRKRSPVNWIRLDEKQGGLEPPISASQVSDIIIMVSEL